MKPKVFVFLRYRVSSSRCFETTYWYHLQGVADQAVSNTLKMETESFAEMSKNLRILTRLSTREHFIEFCRREDFKNYRIFIFGQRQPNIQ